MRVYRKGKGSLSRKMMTWFMLVVLLPTILLSIFLCGSAYNWYYTTILTDNDAILTVISESIENNARLVEHVVDSISYDNGINSLLGDEHSSAYSRVIQQLFEVQKLIVKSEFFLSQLSGDIILFADKDYVPESYWYVLHVDRAMETEDYQKFMDMDQMSGWVGNALIYPSSTVLFKDDNREMLCYYKQIFNGISSRIGIVKCGVALERFFSAAMPDHFDGNIFVLNSDQVVFGSVAGGVDLLDEINPQTARQWVQGRVYISRPIQAMDNMTLVMSIDGNGLTRRALLYALPQLLIALGAGVVMMLTTRRFLHAISKRIDQAVTVAKSAKNDFSIAVLPNNEDDEVSVLIDSFNALITQLQLNAYQQIQHGQREKQALQLALQYQMNPHFLFNTLNWIQMCIEVGVEPGKVSEGTVLLGRLLRYNLEDGAFAPLSQEIGCAQDYIRLMNMRKHDLISLDVRRTNMTPDAKIMRFLLQPLCENAIQHGLIPTRPLHIHVIVSKDQTGMTVVVCNDGSMIPTEKLNKLDTRIRDEQYGNGVGLANIYSRIKLLYGDLSTLSIQSNCGETSITLFLASKGEGCTKEDEECVS